MSWDPGHITPWQAEDCERLSGQQGIIAYSCVTDAAAPEAEAVFWDEWGHLLPHLACEQRAKKSMAGTQNTGSPMPCWSPPGKGRGGHGSTACPWDLWCRWPLDLVSSGHWGAPTLGLRALWSGVAQTGCHTMEQDQAQDASLKRERCGRYQKCHTPAVWCSWVLPLSCAHRSSQVHTAP